MGEGGEKKPLRDWLPLFGPSGSSIFTQQFIQVRSALIEMIQDSISAVRRTSARASAVAAAAVALSATAQLHIPRYILKAFRSIQQGIGLRHVLQN